MQNSVPIEEIAFIYEKHLKIPLVKGIPFILCPVGRVASGKTTVVRPLAKEFNLVRISSDEVRLILRKEKYQYTQEDMLHVVFLLVKKYLGKGYGIAIDANCSTKKVELGKLGEVYKVPLVWIHVNTPEEFILEKLRIFNYDPDGLFKTAEEGIRVYMENKQFPLDLTMPFVYTFDTSKENLLIQISEAIEIIKHKLKS